MDINVNITLSASPALLAALASLAGAAVQAAPAQPQEPARPAKKPASKPAEPKPAPAPAPAAQAEEPKPAEQPKDEEPATVSYEVFLKTIIPINQVVGPDKMRELIAEFGGKGTLRTIPEERRQEFIDRAKAMAEGGAA